MKNLLNLAFVFLTLTAFPQPKTIMLQADNMQIGKENHEKFFATSQKSYRLKLKIDSLEWEKQQAKTGETYTKLWFKNSLPDGNIGEPEIPVVKKLIRIPLGASISARVNKYTMDEIQLSAKGIQHLLFPVQPSARKDQDTLQLPFHLKPEAYHKSTFQSIKPEVSVEVLGNLRGFTIARLTVRPVEYNPAHQKIRVFSNVEVDIDIQETNTKSVSETDPYYSPYFDVVYQSMLNAGGAAYDEHPDLTRYPVSMLIVSHRMFETALQPFVEWKTQKGFSVTVKYTDEIGSTADAIKTYIQNVYNSATPENPAPTFLVIVGDVEQVPASATGTQSGKLTDLYYASVDGDKFPEMYYGRLSATNEAQLTAIIDKILYYERFQFSDASYLNNATLIAGADATWNPAIAQPTIKYATATHFNPTKGWSNIYEYGVTTDPNNPLAISGYTGCYDPQRIAVSFINYTAHCNETNWQDPALSTSAVNAFTNAQQYPFVIANCCLTGNFGYSESVGEAWLRKANGGAVTYIGSSPNSYWKEDMYWAVGAYPMTGDNNGYVPTYDESTTGGYDAPFVSQYTTAGAIMFCGNLAVTQAELNDYTRQINSTYYWEAYNVLGDPSLMPYFKVPEVNQITFPATTAVGVNSISIGAKARSYVSLTRNGQIIGAKYYPTDDLLDITIPVQTEPGKIVLTATRPQTQPFIDTIQVFVADSAYLTLASNTIDDSEGNNNSTADYGETFKVNLLVKNVGKTNATNIGAKITASTGLISLTSVDSIGIGSIDAESEKWINSAFTFSISSNIDDKYSQVFPITFTSTEGSWTSNLRITASAPKIVYNGFTVVDSLMGNRNMLVDRNEVVDLQLEFQNKGSSSIPDFSAQVTLPDSLINVANINLEPISNRTIQPSEKILFTVRLSTSPELPYDTIPFELNYNSANYPKSNGQLTGKVPISLYGTVKMMNGSAKTCGTFFTDSGGENANYSNSENYKLTFEALNDIERFRVEFLLYDTEAGYDYLYAFDGPSTSSNAITGSPFNGKVVPASFYTSSNSITFRFTSDGSQTGQGWKAKLECIVPQQLPKCIENPKPANNELNVEYAQLSWGAMPDALFYDVYIGSHPDSLAYLKRVTSSGVSVALLPSTTYYWRVIPGNHLGLCDKNCETWSFTTSSVVGQAMMANKLVTTDSIWFYDSGGPTANYENNENYTITFKPKTSGKKIKVEFQTFDVESHSTCSYDRLLVFDGPNTQSPQLGTYCGSSLPPVFTATSTTGELTFQFISDANTLGSGWKAKVTSTGSITAYPLTINVKSNGIALPNATVSLNEGLKFTSESGAATFSLPNGTYSYTVNALGYEPVMGTFEINSSAKTINVDLAKQDTVLLQVRSALDHAAVPLAKITVNNKTYFTANDGTATIHIPAGSYTFNITAEGFNVLDTLVAIAAGSNNLTFNLSPIYYNVQLIVTDINGNKTPNATVYVDTLIGETNSEGLAIFTLSRGLKTVSIQKEGFVNTDFWFKVESDSTVQVYLNRVLGNVYNIEFNVTGSGPKGTWPLSNALVKVYSGAELYLQGKTTNSIVNLYLPNGIYSYEVQCEGYLTSTLTEFTVNGSPLQISAALNQITFSITFDVQSKGSPVANATVSIQGYPEQQTGADGTTTFSQIGYEKGLQYRVTHPDYYTLEGIIDATKSGTISVSLTPTSVEIENTDQKVSVYPNPAKGYIKVEANEMVDFISIFSINGLLIQHEQIGSRSQIINLNIPTSGIYIVKLSMGNGRTYYKKLVVQ
ncbi:MAG: C25 family cysteine peptidase [Bacteroidota bacterium]